LTACTVCAAAAQYLYDRSKPHPVYSFGSPHGDVSNKIEEEEEEEEVDDESDEECGRVSDGQAELHNSSSQTSLIRQRLSAEDNGNVVIYSARLAASAVSYCTRRVQNVHVANSVASWSQRCHPSPFHVTIPPSRSDIHITTFENLRQPAMSCRNTFHRFC